MIILFVRGCKQIDRKTMLYCEIEMILSIRLFLKMFSIELSVDNVWNLVPTECVL